MSCVKPLRSWCCYDKLSVNLWPRLVSSRPGPVCQGLSSRSCLATGPAKPETSIHSKCSTEDVVSHTVLQEDICTKTKNKDNSGLIIRTAKIHRTPEYQVCSYKQVTSLNVHKRLTFRNTFSDFSSRKAVFSQAPARSLGGLTPHVKH